MNSVTLYASATATKCGACDAVFWMTQEMYDARRRDHAVWYCPNGHARFYGALSDIEAALRDRDEARAQRNKAWVERDKAERERDAAKRKVAIAAKRHAAGVCEWCRRTFTNVARHMKTKHPEKVDA